MWRSAGTLEPGAARLFALRPALHRAHSLCVRRRTQMPLRLLDHRPEDRLDAREPENLPRSRRRLGQEPLDVGGRRRMVRGDSPESGRSGGPPPRRAAAATAAAVVVPGGGQTALARAARDGAVPPEHRPHDRPARRTHAKRLSLSSRRVRKIPRAVEYSPARAEIPANSGLFRTGRRGTRGAIPSEWPHSAAPMLSLLTCPKPRFSLSTTKP